MIGDELKARTRQFALDVIDLCLKLGSSDLARIVRPQLLRAGTGVAANHRAAARCRSSREFAARLAVVVEEADEAELWLDVLETRQFGPQEAVRTLRRESQELRAIFVASRRTVLKRIKKRRKQSGTTS
jgi:four helix bundle protein